MYYFTDGHPPKFRNPFNRSSEYTQGSPIKLKCHAYGEPPLNVTWLKNGKRLGKADRRHLKSKGWVLNFRELSPTDTGFYTCTATNTFGSVVKTFDIKVVGELLYMSPTYSALLIPSNFHLTSPALKNAASFPSFKITGKMLLNHNFIIS